MSDVIRFEGIERSFAGESVLRGLSLRVRAGEIYALLGRNGAGKTTALSILLGLLRPMAGRSEILGEDSLELSDATRLRIGVVHEGSPAYRWMSVKTALDFEAGTRANFDRKYARSALERLSIPLGRGITKLSRGERAQLGLVFAMAGDPEVLLLDDPAMGLDPVMRREFLEAMVDLLGREGRAVLFSSHILSDVERLADRVGILHQGRLVVDATLDDLKRRVQRRFVRGPFDEPAARARAGGLLRARRVENGWELTLLDCEGERERALRGVCPTLGEPLVPTLEDLFLELTADEAPSAPSAAGAA